MKCRIIFYLGLLFVCGASGCIGKSKDGGMIGISKPRALLTGVLLRPGEEITTKQILRVHVRYKKDGINKAYNALFGPEPFKIVTPEAKAEYRNLAPTWFLKSGWVWLVGDCPLVETDAVSASGDGTTMIAQIDGNIHRFYLLSVSGKESCTVKFKANPAIMRTFSAPREHMYVDADTNANTISAPQTVSGAAQPIKDFVDYVIGRAGDADILTGS